jgi:hypothetical protein
MPGVALEKGAATLIGKTAQTALETAANAALFQAGDEASKAFIKDPNQSAESVVSHIGLAGLFGGGIGASIPPLWRISGGEKLAGFLKSIRSKVLSAEESKASQALSRQAPTEMPAAGSTIEASFTHSPDMAAIDALSGKAGIELAPEIKSALGGSHAVRAEAQQLAESGAKAGDKFRESLEGFKQQASDKALEHLDRANDLAEPMSDAEAGEALKKHVGEEVKRRLEPLQQQFDEISSRLATTPLPKELVTTTQDALHDIGIKHGYHLAPEGAGAKELAHIVRDLPNVKTLEDLRRFQSVVRENLTKADVPGLRGAVNSVLREAEEGAILQKLPVHGPELMEGYKAARSGWRDLHGLLDSLDERLHVGRWHGPGSFIQALDEMQPERVTSRLAATRDTGLQTILEKELPQAASFVKGYHVDKLLKGAMNAPGAHGTGINTKTLFRNLNKMSPELKQFALGPEKLDKLEAVQSLLEQIPERINPSGTARTAHKTFLDSISGVGALLSFLTGHSIGAGYVIGKAAHYLGTEAPDAARLALLKYLGSDGATNPVALKAFAEAAQASISATRIMARGAENVVKGVSVSIPARMLPSERDLKLIDSAVKAAQVNPSSLLPHEDDDSSQYMPEHSAGMAAVKARAADYLSQKRPSRSPQGILNDDRIVSQMEESKYRRQLKLAAQPLLLLDHLHKGILTTEDITTVKTIYPSLYNAVGQELLRQAIDAKQKGKKVPYHVRMGMSLLLGQPLDASMSPEALMLNQGVSQPTPPTQQGPQKPPKSTKSSLSKEPASDQTPAQARELKRQ